MVPAQAQELSPRAFWPSPTGTRIGVLGYAYTDGDTTTDPSLPVKGVNSEIHTVLGSYLQSFDLFDRTANFIIELPHASGRTTAKLPTGEVVKRDYEGFGDVAATLSINLVGAPAMDAEEFRAMLADPGPIIGASLRVQAPTGEYDDDRLVNIGANRWASKLEFGAIFPFSPGWLLELELGAWYFQDNDDFATGKREQDSIASIEAHLVHTFNPQVWASLDLNYYRGGRTIVGGKRLDDLQRTSKIGGTLVFPMDRNRVVRVGYSWGSVTGTDNDYSSLLVTLAHRFGA